MPATIHRHHVNRAAEFESLQTLLSHLNLRAMHESSEAKVRFLPSHGWLGLFLLAICWPLNWCLPGMRTAYLFFPLWLGYVLLVDALVFLRRGTSIWTRCRWRLALLFVVSSPIWWMFEMINRRTGNWEYLGNAQFTELEYYLLCSLSFSTVMPAVFETAELVRSFGWIQKFADGPRIQSSQSFNISLLFTGLIMLAFTLAWPKYCYPFVWTSVALILEPLNHWLRRPTFQERLSFGDWRPVIALSTGALICGFFWEMWNYYSFPKWVYHTPGAQFLHIFEMPLLGYLGYIPFALELYGLKNFLWPNGVKLDI